MSRGRNGLPSKTAKDVSSCMGYLVMLPFALAFDILKGIFKLIFRKH